MSGTYTEHNKTEIHGFEIVDATATGEYGTHDDLIWVAYMGDGRWLKADEVEQLAGVLFGAAAIHRARRAGVPA